MRFMRPLAAALLIGAGALAQGFGASPAAAQPAPQPYPDQQGGPPPGPGGPSGYGQQPSPAPGQHMTGAQKFDAANVTHDGRLTRDQAQQAGYRAVFRNFDAIDRDHKGYVTKQDIREWHRAKRAAMQAARQQQGGSPQGQPPQAQAPQGQDYPATGYQGQQVPPPPQ